MLKKTFLAITLALVALTGGYAQRKTDALDRGLVAVYRTNGTNEGTFLSWRVLPNEYYDVTYNVYRNGTKLNSTPLSVSNYVDANGSSSASYTVRAVVRGREQAACAAVTPWSAALNKYFSRNYVGYKDITLQKVYSRANSSKDITADYSPNDASVADLDGDGELEIILKRINTADAANLYRAANTDYTIIEAYKLNGKRLWWIDCGPNMVSLNSTEIDAVAYDWDQDGKAEVLLRGADGMLIHMADGKTWTIGNKNVNTRSTFAGMKTSQFCWTHTGSEYLIYMNGQTGCPYQVTDYPLKRLESGETDLNKVWGDSYGHRSSKYFFGAPYLDGRKPSIFLARGIYTQEKMIALDVDGTSHKLTTRWTWNCKNSGSQWYGQGYHNFSIADVDWDGRDEIVYGSMVIDDNGRGLSTTGLGHGDAQHVGDFNPYVHGQEVFACNEDKPACNYRDATTSNIYYRLTSSGDDGRALMGNFSNDYHGAQGRSTQSPMISSITAKSIGNDFVAWSDLNAGIYFDGDLLQEILNSPGTAKEAKIDKPGKGRLFTSSGCNMNNDSKNNPCFQGDILGDWREEIILRHGSNGLRIYTTAIPTEYRIPTLWADHQYRQSEVWQMCAYNQPPHVSYFLGEAEGITVAPPPLTNTDRTEIYNGGNINSGHNNKQVMLATTGNMTVSVDNGASPWVVFVNAPTWVQGHDNNSVITKTTYTHTLTGGAFTGATRVVKQGDGLLAMPKVTETYTGNTDVWAGGLIFDGVMENSRVWMNRFTALKSTGGSFKQGVTLEYDAKLIPGGSNVKSNVYTRSLTMNFGSRIVFDIYSEDISADQVDMDTLTLNTVNWSDGPAYLKPVFQFIQHNKSGQNAPAQGAYLLGKVKKINGSLDNVIVEGLGGVSYKLAHNGSSLYLLVGNAQLPQEQVKTLPSTNKEYSGSIYWAFDKGTADQAATLSADFEGYVSASTTLGSNLSWGGVKELDGLNESRVGVKVDNEVSANSANALAFNVTPAENCAFTVTSIEFTATRIGTDGGSIDVSWAGKSVAKGLKPARNKANPEWTTYTYNVSGAQDMDVQSLLLNLYQLGITKQFGLANVKINGKLSRPAKQDEQQASTTTADGTILWVFDQGTDGQQATLGSDLAGYVITDVQKGSGLTYGGVKELDGLTETRIGVTVDNEQTATNDNKLSFCVTPASGCSLNITKIEFTATRIGTDGGKIDVSWAGQKIATALRPARNKANPEYTTFVYNVSTSNPDKGHKLTFNFYQLGITKQFGLANVKLYGTLTRNASSAKSAAFATGIDGARVGEDDNEPWYTLSGVRVQRPTRSGVYIHKGKKILVK